MYISPVVFYLPELIEVLRSFEAVRKRWLHAELELKKQKELLVKSDVTRAALEVKLKHARNQLDVEIKKRYKAEADYQCLVREPLNNNITFKDARFVFPLPEIAYFKLFY